jgi:internalin A
MHELIEQQSLLWKNGVVLKRDSARAEVIEDYYRREIFIRVAGEDKRALLAITTYELERIHYSFNRLKYNTLVPCNCGSCVYSDEPHCYPYDVLRQFVQDRQEMILCHKSYEMVSVLDLLEHIGDTSIKAANKGIQ